MKYLERRFSVPVAGKAYSDGWERIFGPSPLCQCGHIERDHNANAGCMAIVSNWGPDEKVCPCGQFVQVPDEH